MRVTGHSPVSIAPGWLAALDSDELRASLAEARARVSEAEAEVRLAEANLRRRQDLANQQIVAKLIRRFTDAPPDFIYERADFYSTAGVSVASALRVPLAACQRQTSTPTRPSASLP